MTGCEWHKNDLSVEPTIGCQDCGTLLWSKDCPACGKTFLDWESKGHDDVCSAPYVTEDGDLVCYTCLKAHEQAMAEEAEYEDFYRWLMNIDKAIRILSADESDRHPDTNPEVNEATKLAIEALKRIQAQRVGLPVSRWFMLPGETEP